jgi:hypothetical protein
MIEKLWAFVARSLLWISALRRVNLRTDESVYESLFYD